MSKKEEKQEEVYYSLMNITNANILSARLNDLSWDTQRKKTHMRQRNFKISQFQTHHYDILTYFLNSESMETRWTMGVHEIWVKKEDIDDLYAVLAIACLNNFCNSWEKQNALFGAFLFNKDPDLFIATDFVSSQQKSVSLLKQLHLGKEFLEFLETFNVLSFIKRSGQNQGVRNFFSVAELELIARPRKDIITKFEYINPDWVKQQEEEAKRMAKQAAALANTPIEKFKAFLKELTNEVV